MEPYHGKGSYREVDNPTGCIAACQFAAIEEEEQEAEVEGIEQGYMRQEPQLVQMPREDQDAQQEETYTSRQIMLETGFTEQLPPPHDIAQIVIRQSSDQPHGSEAVMGREVAIDIIQEEGCHTKQYHDEIAMAGTVEAVGQDVQDEDGRHIPQRTVQRFAETAGMLQQQGPDNGTHDVGSCGHGTLLYIEPEHPVGQEHQIVEQIRQYERIPIFTPIGTYASSVFLQVTGKEEEHSDDASLKITEVEKV